MRKRNLKTYETSTGEKRKGLIEISTELQKELGEEGSSETDEHIGKCRSSDRRIELRRQIDAGLNEIRERNEREKSG